MVRREYFPLSTVLYYGIGGIARFLLEAATPGDVFEAVNFVRATGISRLVVAGLGSNLLFPDGLFDGAVLRIVGPEGAGIREGGEELVEAFAGETLDGVINFGHQRRLIGLEWAGGLPGTVGAAVRGNVGAFGGELSQVLDSAQVLEIREQDFELRTLTRGDLGFAYRESLVKRDRGLIVLSATFRLKVAGHQDVAPAREAYEANIAYRRRNHPMEYPTCGSVFKNVERPPEVERVLSVWPDVRESVEGRWHGKVSMGYAITRLGLRGYRIGRAEISAKHSNFIVNLGGARFSDVQGIIDKVKEEFLKAFGFVPEPEVEIIG